MATANETNTPITRRQRRVQLGRRLFREMTEEERAARFERIMRLLDFLFKIMPTLTGKVAVDALLLADDASTELFAAATHAWTENTEEA